MKKLDALWTWQQGGVLARGFDDRQIAKTAEKTLLDAGSPTRRSIRTLRRSAREVLTVYWVLHGILPFPSIHSLDPYILSRRWSLCLNCLFLYALYFAALAGAPRTRFL
ncbi:hypothetical protein C8R46DRAFT_1145321 [Mycena filopes]|nr:hypothetical protein C8R46DRAFT_1145321 [Mycena filopes]